ncbi:MAG: MCE family protein [Alphaproteobacteria bacterium]|jgi:phospholipid/cholesterol/gamma-HCH transport system substrate-binding protein|nr:MCE family protein [Alphaproteobacteria bacterium]
METRANYVAVGAFVLLLMVGLAAFALWLSQVALQQDTERYRIFFTGAVTGLQAGSTVRYRGIPVGSVAEVGIDPDNIERVRVLVELEPDTPVRTDSVARLELQGITGGVYVLIEGGSQQAPPLIEASDERPPVIPSEPSTIQAVLDSLPEVLAQATVLLDSANALLSEDNVAAMTGAIADVKAITGALSAQTASLESVVSGMDGLVTNLDGLVEETRLDAARLSDRLDTLLANVDDRTGTATDELEAAADDIRELADTYTALGDQVNGLVGDVRPAIRDFAGTGLPEFTLMVTELRGLAETLTRVAEQIERAPARFLFGESDQGVPTE